MKVNIIVAADPAWGIGWQGGLPWSHNKEDMDFFKTVTTGQGNNAIVFGPNTWVSLPKKPLARRKNYIWHSNDGNIAQAAAELGYDVLWICGGAWCYKRALDDLIINEIVICRMKRLYRCDTFFPFARLYGKFERQLNINYTSFTEERWFPID